MDSITYHVPDISCEHCVKTIQRVVKEEVAGVGEITGDHETKMVTIAYAPPATTEAIVASMTEWDFPPNIVSA